MESEVSLIVQSDQALSIQRLATPKQTHAAMFEIPNRSHRSRYGHSRKFEEVVVDCRGKE